MDQGFHMTRQMFMDLTNLLCVPVGTKENHHEHDLMYKTSTRPQHDNLCARCSMVLNNRTTFFNKNWTV